MVILRFRNKESAFRPVDEAEDLVRVPIEGANPGRTSERRRASRVACSLVLVKMSVPYVFDGGVADNLAVFRTPEVEDGTISWSDSDKEVDSSEDVFAFLRPFRLVTPRDRLSGDLVPSQTQNSE